MSAVRVLGLATDPAVRFLCDVRAELEAARAKHPDEEGVLTDAEWLAVLTEEVGECAKAIQDETDEQLRAELVQVAAMAMRWALAIPHGRQRPPWATRVDDGAWTQTVGFHAAEKVVRCTRDAATCAAEPCCRRPRT